MLNGRGIFGNAGKAALALAFTAFAFPAQADTAPITAYYHDPLLPVGTTYPNNNTNAVINVPVTASVGGICGFATGAAPNATINAGSIDTTAWTADVPFTAQCTAPWRIAVSSANGALKNTATVPTGYSNRAPYDVTLNVPFDTGTSNGTIVSSCAVKDLNATTTTAACDFDGAATTTNGLAVPRSFNLTGSYIRVAAPAYVGSDILVGGTYTDTLTVTISPSI